MKKYKSIFVIISILTAAIIFFTIIISKECKKKEIFDIVQSLGIGFLTECYNEKEIKNNIKRLIQGNKFIYNIVANIKIKLAPNFGKSRDIYQSLDFNNTYKRKNFNEVIDLKGIISDDNILKKYEIKIKNNNINLKKWNRSYGNNWNTKFFDSQKINKNNIEKLELKWKFDPIEISNSKKIWKSRIGINPIYHDGIVYFVSANQELNAVSADLGKLIWSKEFQKPMGQRGILYHDSFIFINSGKKLYKIHSKTGEVDDKFGTSGSANVGKSLIAPVIYKNLIILPNMKNEILSVDLYSGKILHKIQMHKAYGFNLYAVAWGGAALDQKNGIYYIVTGNPKPYHVGVFRPGENKNANSIIAFDIDKKKIIWTFQDVRHDLWNLDVSAPPILADLDLKGKIIETVIVTTKTGNTLLFERKTGLPIYDINYIEVPESNVPNEFVAKKQIFIEKPERFSKIEFEINDLRTDLLDDEEYVNNLKKNSVYGYFQPPTLGKDTIMYGLIGGNNWYGSAYNPINKRLFVPSTHVPFLMKVFPIAKTSNTEKISQHKNYNLYKNKCASCHESNRNGVYKINTYEKGIKYIPSLVGFNTFEPIKGKMKNLNELKKKHNNNFDITNEELIKLNELFFEWDNQLKNENKIGFDAYYTLLTSKDGRPISKPPWGTITSINLSNGTVDWKIPFGYYKNKNIGVVNVGGLAVSSSNLIFATGTSDEFAFVIDGDTGKELWKYKMKAAGTTPPLIYEYKNKQYVSFLSTGGITGTSSRSSSLYTFSLK